jgi:hypothetical protein
MPGAAHRDWEGGKLPLSPLDAHGLFMARDLPAIRAALAGDVLASLTVVLAPASSDHDAWRRAVAGDLARAFTPVRVNIAAGTPGEALDALLDYLRDAPGVTGHYVQAHE